MLIKYRWFKMVNIGCVIGSNAAHVLSQASIPNNSLVVGFDIAEYGNSTGSTGSLALAYAYKV